MPSKIAAQLYTIRESTKTRKDFQESLKKLRQIGYKAVQLSAVGCMEGENPEVTVQEARKLLDDAGLRCISTHRGWDLLATRTEQEIAFHQALGCTHAAIPSLPQSYRKQGEAGYRQFLRDAQPVIAKFKAAGITVGYHNHAFEFQRAGPGSKTLFDIFIEEGGSDFTLEPDLYWVVHAGANPVRILERCRGRVPVIHVKDKEVVEEGPTYAPVGEGNLDWDSILPAAQKAGVQWYAVEQDTCRRDPFDCLRSSFEFLRARGL